MLMLHEFKQLPEPLQKQTLTRLALGVLFLILFAVTLASSGDIYLWLPSVGAALFFTITAIMLHMQAAQGSYVIIDGECADVILTSFRRHSKYLILNTDSCKLRVYVHNRRRYLPVGASVRIFVSNKTPIYEQNGAKVLYTYLALETK
jgi:hypothetical protein